MLRFQYKNSVDSLASVDDVPSQATSKVSDEARQRIEANKKRAMELKEKKRREAAGQSSTAGVPEDDMEALWAEAEASGQAPRSAFDDEDPFGFDDEDPFGHGSGSNAAPASKQQSGLDFEDEDPFGFGGAAFDDDSAPAPSPLVKSPAPSQPAVDPEVARRIAENREKAMARKRKREEDAGVGQSAAAGSDTSKPEAQSSSAQAQSSSTAAPAATLEETSEKKSQLEQGPFTGGEEEDLPFGFGGGLDDP